MAIITRPPANVPRKAVTVRMPLPVAETLHEYASFISSGLDHVVVEALTLVFRKDAEFKAWQNARSTAFPRPAAEPASEESGLPMPELPIEARRNGRGAPAQQRGEQ